jgi:hypothetical protein
MSLLSPAAAIATAFLVGHRVYGLFRAHESDPDRSAGAKADIARFLTTADFRDGIGLVSSEVRRGTDFAAIETDLQLIMGQPSGLPSRARLVRIRLGFGSAWALLAALMLAR